MRFAEVADSSCRMAAGRQEADHARGLRLRLRGALARFRITEGGLAAAFGLKNLRLLVVVILSLEKCLP